jgi:hypothetical protein
VQRFIVAHNIAHYREVLSRPGVSEATRKTTVHLLAEAERELLIIDDPLQLVRLREPGFMGPKRPAGP